MYGIHVKILVLSDDLTKLLREIMQEARNLTKAERYVGNNSDIWLVSHIKCYKALKAFIR